MHVKDWSTQNESVASKTQVQAARVRGNWQLKLYVLFRFFQDHKVLLQLTFLGLAQVTSLRCIRYHNQREGFLLDLTASWSIDWKITQRWSCKVAATRGWLSKTSNWKEANGNRWVSMYEFLPKLKIMLQRTWFNYVGLTFEFFFGYAAKRYLSSHLRMTHHVCTQVVWLCLWITRCVLPKKFLVFIAQE